MTHGIEITEYPFWTSSRNLVDTIAGFGQHRALLVGGNENRIGRQPEKPVCCHGMYQLISGMQRCDQEQLDSAASLTAIRCRGIADVVQNAGRYAQISPTGDCRYHCDRIMDKTISRAARRDLANNGFQFASFRTDGNVYGMNL